MPSGYRRRYWTRSAITATLGGVIFVMLTIAANAWAAGADFAGAKFVRANAAELDLDPRWIPLLGALKAAGAAGLLLGLLGVPWIGLAAGIGLVLFFAGALVVHVRARVFHNIAAPAAFFVLAVLSTSAAA
jgi:hypothetical protein